MLATQVQYWNLQENKRHNLVFENQTQQQINESVRHNKVTEDLGYKTLAETTRHNKASEAIGWGNIQLGYANLSELSRHNKASEAIGRTQATASMIGSMASRTQSQVAMKNAETNVYNAVTNRRAQSNTGKFQEASEKQGWINSISGAFSSVGNTFTRFSDSGAKWLDALIPF